MKNIIHIFGASGSGTTTLGKRIVDELGFSLMDTDDYFWLPTDPPYISKRPVEERINMMLQDINDARNVVISGSLTDWGDLLIPYFTLAIRVNTDTDVRIERIKQRERKHFGTRIDENGDMYEDYLAFIEWAKKYDEGDTSIRSKKKHDEWQGLLQCELIEVDGNNIYDFDMDIIRRKTK